MQTPKDIITHWGAKILADPSCAKAIDAVYKFVVAGPQGGVWVLKCKDPVEIKAGEGESECTIHMESKDFVALGTRSLNPQVAFLMGKIKVSGDISLALRLHHLF